MRAQLSELLFLCRITTKRLLLLLKNRKWLLAPWSKQSAACLWSAGKTQPWRNIKHLPQTTNHHWNSKHVWSKRRIVLFLTSAAELSLTYRFLPLSLSAVTGVPLCRTLTKNTSPVEEIWCSMFMQVKSLTMFHEAR